MKLDSKETVIERLHEIWRESSVSTRWSERILKKGDLTAFSLKTHVCQEAERSLQIEDADRGRYPKPAEKLDTMQAFVLGLFRQQRQAWINIA
jgi:hypothetical protein